jgi:mono/diheme cytochrome c family protein
MKMGKSIYADECAACHGGDGKGTPAMFPSINGSPAVQQSDATSLMRVVLRGARSAGTDAAPTAPAMPAFEWLLTDEQVAAVLTYVRNAWGNAAPPVASSDVAKARKDFIERKD